MLLIVLVLLWGAFLIPSLVRKIRDWRSDRSIEHFHAEHDLLARQAVVAPVHRLDETDHYDAGFVAPAPSQVPDRTFARQPRPRLTVVHDDDTYQTLEARGSWDEWSADYEFDEPMARRAVAPSAAEPPRARPTTNRYAAAYSSTPTSSRVTAAALDIRRRSMRARRRVIFSRLVLTAFVLTVLAYFVGASVVWDLAIVTWIAVVSFVALAFYAVGQGYLHESSVGLGRRHRPSLATVEPMAGRRGGEGRRAASTYDEYDEYDDDQQFDGDSWRADRYAATGATRMRDERFDRYALG